MEKVQTSAERLPTKKMAALARSFLPTPIKIARPESTARTDTIESRIVISSIRPP